jgi:hypothetical protein
MPQVQANGPARVRRRSHAPIYENVEGFNTQTLAFLQRHS